MSLGMNKGPFRLHEDLEETARDGKRLDLMQGIAVAYPDSWFMRKTALDRGFDETCK